MGGLLGVNSLLYTQICVSDMDRSVDWYERFIGFRRLDDCVIGESPSDVDGPRGSVRRVQGVVAGAQLELIACDGPSARIGTPGDIISICFSVDDMSTCSSVLSREGITVNAPLPFDRSKPYSTIGIQDPDGIRVELTDFHGAVTTQPSAPGLLPITHWLYTQARVSDMQRSLEWYSRLMGFGILNELNLEGKPYEENTGIPGVHIRMIQGAFGTVTFELVNIRSDDPEAAKKLGPAAGRLPAFTIGIADVHRCYQIAQDHGVRCEGPPASFPPTPYHSLIILDPDGTRIDLCDFVLPAP